MKKQIAMLFLSVVFFAAALLAHVSEVSAQQPVDIKITTIQLRQQQMGVGIERLAVDELPSYVDGTQPWVLAKDEANAAKTLTALLSTQPDPFARAGDELAKTWLTRLDREKVRAALKRLYAENLAKAIKAGDFRAAIDAGAVIVSGSQAHFPQTMEFHNDTFIHYGLGNLFFDQMGDIPPVPGIRRIFLDRHVIYNGQYISTELLTGMMEDHARPRPMTRDERVPFLQEYFTLSGWLPVVPTPPISIGTSDTRPANCTGESNRRTPWRTAARSMSAMWRG